MMAKSFSNRRKVIAHLVSVLAIVSFMQLFVFNNAIANTKSTGKKTVAQKAPGVNKQYSLTNPQVLPNQDYSLIDPFQEMSLLQDQMDTIFNQTYNRFQNSPGFARISPDQMMFAPRLDLKDNGKNYIVKMDVPGVDKSNIKITLQNNTLTISGKREEDKKQTEKSKMVTMERRLGEFSRTFSLPGPVNGKQIKAVCKNGVLTVSLPKIAKENANIKIKVE